MSTPNDLVASMNNLNINSKIPQPPSTQRSQVKPPQPSTQPQQSTAARPAVIVPTPQSITQPPPPAPAAAAATTTTATTTTPATPATSTAATPAASTSTTGTTAATAETFDIAAYQRENKIAIDQRVTTEDVEFDESVTFQSLGLSLSLLKGIGDCGFTRPSPIQAQAIPQILMRNDVIARAKNGTGKTAAFCIPCVHLVEPAKNQTQILIISSTRELVTQICNFLKVLAGHLPIKILPSFGGNDFQSDMIALQQGVHILVTTTGRAESIANKGFLKNLKVCVIDEADKIFSSPQGSTNGAGGANENFLVSFFKRIPACQRILFSATYQDTMMQFTQQFLPNAQFVNTMDDIALRGVTQHYIVVNEDLKVKALRKLLDMLKYDQCIIFCVSSQRAEALAQLITTKWQIPCFSLSASFAQADRARITDDFRDKKFRLLVATDIIARGFDLASVNVVINFDLTASPETYLHRIGRSGRFGHLGLAINFVDERNASTIQAYEQALGARITQLPNVIDHSVYEDTRQNHTVGDKK